MDVDNIRAGSTANFKITVSNLGSEDITASDEVDIFDSSGTKVATVYAGSTSIKPKESGELFASWEAKDVQPGVYRTVATVRYNGATVTAENSFLVGGLVVNIIDVSVGTIQKDSIGKFNVKIDSLWNDEITDVYVEIFVFEKTHNYTNYNRIK